MAGGTSAALADDAEGMGIVHHHPGAVGLGQPADLRQRAQIRAHAVDAIHHDELTGRFRHALQALFQFFHIIVPEADLSIVTKDGLFPIEISEESVARKIVIQNYISKEFLEDNPHLVETVNASGDVLATNEEKDVNFVSNHKPNTLHINSFDKLEWRS